MLYTSGKVTARGGSRFLLKTDFLDTARKTRVRAKPEMAPLRQGDESLPGDIWVRAYAY